jgi:hypothetical protein
MFQVKVAGKNQNTFYVQQRFPESRAVCEIMCKKCGGAREAADDSIIWCTRFCMLDQRVRAHTHTQKYVILIAFAQQQSFRERASLLHYTCIASLCFLWKRQFDLSLLDVRPLF